MPPSPLRRAAVLEPIYLRTTGVGRPKQAQRGVADAGAVEGQIEVERAAHAERGEHQQGGERLGVFPPLALRRTRHSPDRFLEHRDEAPPQLGRALAGGEHLVERHAGRSPGVHRILERVALGAARARRAERSGEALHRRLEVVLALTLRDGRSLTGGSDYPRGNPENPAPLVELEDKFRDLVAPRYSADLAERAIAAVDGLEACPDMASWLAALRLA